MKIKKHWLVAFLLPGVLLFCFIYGISIVVLFSTSFTDWSIGNGFNFIGLKNYIDLFNAQDFLNALRNTFIWIILQSTFHVAIGVVFALIVLENKWYHRFAKTVYMLPNIISRAALGMLFLNLFNPSFGLVNDIVRRLGFENFNQNWFMDPSTAFGTVSITWIPFAAVVSILILAEITAIPNTLFEAAAIDGANKFQINMMIILPIVKNVIGTSTILAATSMLQSLGILIMTTNGGPGSKTMNLPLLIYKTALRDNNFGLANAQGVILILVGILSILVIRKVYKMDREV